MSARFTITLAIFATLASTAPLCAQDAPASKMRQVVYPVADLIVPADMDMSKPRRGGSATLETTLMQLIQDTCEPKTWNTVGGPGTAQYMPLQMSLVVNQTQRCQDRIRDLLAELRKVQDTQISIESRYLTLSAAWAKKLEAMGASGRLGKFLPADGPDAVCLSDREVMLVLTLAQEDRHTNVLAAPKITVFNAQKCVLTVADMVGVREGDVDQDGKAITSTKVEVGIRNVLQPVVEPQDGSVRLAVECSLTMRSDTTARNRRFATQKIQQVVRVPQKQTVALKLGVDAQGQHQYVLLTPRVLRECEVAVSSSDAPEVQSKRPRREPSLRVYPIADLLAPIVADPAAGAKRVGAYAPMTDQLLIELITSSVSPSTWHGRGGEGAIHYYPLGQALVVVQREEIQDEVGNLLAALRRLYDLRVSLDCRVVELSEAAAERIAQGHSRAMQAVRSTPLSERGEGSEEQDRTGPIKAAPARAAEPASTSKSLLPLSKSGLTLNPRDTQELRRLLAEEAPAAEHTLGAVTFNGAPVRIDKSKPYTFATDVNVAIQDGRVVVKPVTRTVRVGTIIEMLPVVKADREGLTLEISVEHGVLAPTSPTQTVRVGPPGEETEHTLQAPSFHTLRMKSTAVLSKTGTLVLPLGIVMSETRNEFGPPVLSKIPYVSRMFRNVGYGREARQLYVVITPEIYER